MTSKKLLRYKPACSDLSDMDIGNRFRWVISDDLSPTHINHVIFCSGQVYYDAFEMRTKLGLKNVAIIRLE